MCRVILQWMLQIVRLKVINEYFDVQYVVEGEECFGYEPVENLIPSVEYDAEKDLIFIRNLRILEVSF